MLMIRNRPILFFSFLFVALLSIAFWALFMGPIRAPDRVILLNIRLPRVCLGMLVGMALATTGVLFQGLLRNPLADPYILGTSGGAALGLLVGQWIGGVFFYYGMIFLGALCATLSSYLLARTERSVSIVNLLLSGMMVSAFCGALIFLFFTLQSHSTFSTIFFLMGSLMEGDWLLISISSTIIFLGMAMAFCLAPKLNIFSLGEEKVQTLGISVELFKFTVFILASLMVSAAVALAGPIGFVGLMVPHITRLIIGPNHRVLIPGAALIGGILLLMADALARTIAAPLEIPVGVITAMMGAPFFLWLLRKKRKEKYF